MTHVGAAQLPRLTASLDAAGLGYSTITLPHGEGTNRWEKLGEAVEGLLAARLERGDLVIALGGGVIGDLAGFAAVDHPPRHGFRPDADLAAGAGR